MIGWCALSYDTLSKVRTLACPAQIKNFFTEKIANELLDLKLFQLWNGDFIFFIAYLQQLQTLCWVLRAVCPNLGHTTPKSSAEDYAIKTKTWLCYSSVRAGHNKCGIVSDVITKYFLQINAINVIEASIKLRRRWFFWYFVYKGYWRYTFFITH